MAAYDPFGNRYYGGTDAASNPYPNSRRNTWGGMGASSGAVDPASGRATVDPNGALPNPNVASTNLRSQWGGMGSSTSNVDPFTGRSLPNPDANVASGPTQTRTTQSTPSTDPNPGFVPNQFRVPSGGTVDPNSGAYVPPGGGGSGAGSSYSFTTPNGLTQPLPPGGMNPNPPAVQQWKAPSAEQAAQGFTTAPDGPLAPEYANMQTAVQAAIQRNQNNRPGNYSLATNNAGVWLDPGTGGTWLAPGTGSYNAWEVFGTDRANPNSPYVLPSGTYRPDRVTGALTLLQGK